MTQTEARKIMLWKAIERYRTAGGREEHHAYKEALDNYIDDMLDVSEISESELLAQYKAGHDGLSYKVAWLEKQLDCVQKILVEIDKKCGSGFIPWQIEDAYAEYQGLIDAGPDNAGNDPRN